MVCKIYVSDIIVAAGDDLMTGVPGTSIDIIVLWTAVHVYWFSDIAPAALKQCMFVVWLSQRQQNDSVYIFNIMTFGKKNSIFPNLHHSCNIKQCRFVGYSYLKVKDNKGMLCLHFIVMTADDLVSGGHMVSANIV